MTCRNAALLSDYFDTVLTDLYRFDVDRKVWSVVRSAGNSPTPRYSHGFLNLMGFLYVFGGQRNAIRKFPAIHRA